MKNFIIGFGIFSLWSLIGLWGLSIFITNDGNEKQAVVDTNISVVPATPIEKESIDTQSLQLPLFIINRTNSAIKELNTQRFKDSLKLLLSNNPNSKLQITSFYEKSETEDIAKQRSYTLKKILTSNGFDSLRIEFVSEGSKFSFDQNDEYADAFKFEVITPNIKPELLPRKVLASGFESNSFKPAENMSGYIDSLKLFLSEYPDKKVLVIGHTDNVGEEVDNEWIGMQRAKNVRQYLIKQGIEAGKIQALSKGESEPVADNNTKLGRRQNRRIEILFN